MEIFIKPEEFYIGFTVDETFILVMDEKEIGKGGISETDNPNEVYLEWVELLPEYKGKGLIRPVLSAIAAHYGADTLLFEASIDYTEMYSHLGAVKTEYDDFRDMQGYKLSVDTLKTAQDKDKENRMKFVGFEDIYENCNAGTDYWVICNNLPQKYMDEAKAIDGDNYLESCFGIVITYGYEGYPDEEKEREWFIDCNAPFYVDNDGNWNYLDYTLSDEEREEVIKLCKDEMDREQELESLKEELTNIINECESEELTKERRTQLDERYLEVQNRISELQEKDLALGIKPTAKKGKSR